MRRVTTLASLASIAFMIGIAGDLAAAIFEVDFAKTNGTFRPLHGINKGPLVGGGLMDLTEQHRALGTPFTRLHDSLKFRDGH